MPIIDLEIKRKRRIVRATTKARIGVLGRGDGNPYCDGNTRLWCRWIGTTDANGNATTGQPFKVYAGDTNYLPQEGRQVYVGIGRNGKLTVLGPVPEDLEAAGLDLRALNPNDPYRQFDYPNNNVLFRSDALADDTEDGFKANLNQLLYRDAYGNWNLWNGTDEDTHLDFEAFRDTLATDEHCLAIAALRTLENNWQTFPSTPKSAFTPFTISDLQEVADKLDAECIHSRVYRIAWDMDTLIADPVTDWDLRQWINVPARLGNPTIITKNERVRENHQLLIHGELGATTGDLEALGDVGVIDGTEADEDSGGTGGITQLTGDGTAGPGSGSQTLTLATVNGAPGTFRNARITVNGKGLTTAAEHGPNVKPAVRLATAAALPASTYNNGTAGVGATLTANANGALSVDGVSVAVNDRVLVKNQSSGAQNGIYIVTAAGSGGAPFVLTRDGDSDASAEILNTVVFVHEGTVNATSWYACTNTSAITVGTTAVTFAGGEPISSRLTTKGDLLTHTGTIPVRLPVGTTNGHVLRVASSESTGLKWDDSLVHAKHGCEVRDIRGDLAVDSDATHILLTQGSYWLRGRLVYVNEPVIIDVANAGNWIGGVSQESNGEFIKVYGDEDGNIKLSDKFPNYTYPHSSNRKTTGQINESGWNGTTALGLDGATIDVDNLSTVLSASMNGMLALVYTDSGFTTGRDRGSAAGGSVDAMSAMLISTADNSFPRLFVYPGHNVAINDNDYFIIVPNGPIEYMEVSGTWYRYLGAIYNNASGNLDGRRLDYRAFHQLSSSYSVTSTTFTDIDSTNINFRILSSGGDIDMSFSGSLANGSSSGGVKFGVLVNLDANTIPTTHGFQATLPTGNTTTSFAWRRRFRLVIPGTHLFKPRFAAVAAATTARIVVAESLGGVTWDMNPHIVVERVR